MFKEYLASYESGWDLTIHAKSWKDAEKDARSQQKEYGKLYYVRRVK